MNETRQRPLRLVVVGLGAGVFHMHQKGLRSGLFELVAGSDVRRDVAQQRAAEMGCAFYTDHTTMLAETEPDVAVVCTPHPFHAPIAIDCLRAGCHVLVEKPMAVQVMGADAMIKAASQAQRLLAVNFQYRFRPGVRAAKRLIQEGQLGEIQHVEMVATWTRTARYYEQSSWRGTWRGEGGGVLMNQSPHDLDLLCHLVGMPNRVVGWTRTLLHRIETEDTAQAMLEWPNGALGTLHVSTAEAGIKSRLEIAGTGGWLSIKPGELSFFRFDTDLREFVVASTGPYDRPQAHPVPLELEPECDGHLCVYRNLHEAILHGTPLVADGAEGRMSLELANAMVYSSYAHEEVDLPLDRAAYAALLEDLKAGRIAGGSISSAKE